MHIQLFTILDENKKTLWFHVNKNNAKVDEAFTKFSAISQCIYVKLNEFNCDNKFSWIKEIENFFILRKISHSMYVYSLEGPKKKKKIFSLHTKSNTNSFSRNGCSELSIVFIYMLIELNFPFRAKKATRRNTNFYLKTFFFGRLSRGVKIFPGCGANEKKLWHFWEDKWILDIFIILVWARICGSEILLCSTTFHWLMLRMTFSTVFKWIFI